ncbi:MAG: HD-GYP domain-containing protein [Nitrospiraceae bacterium]|nr:MAG: HD-GYP domain-containing protein [Nitrospiraceae bacterium]
MGVKETTELQGGAADFINQIAVLLRTAQIHSMNNHAFVSLIDKFVSSAAELLINEKTLALELRGEYFYLNDFRVRYSPECVMNFDFLLREFRKAELGSVIIKPGLVPEDMKTFIRVFIASSFLQRPFDSMKGELSSLPGLEIRKIRNVSEENADLDIKKLVRKTYFSAVSYTKGIFHSVRSGEKVNLKKAKRVVASLVDRLVEQEQLLLGMTVIKDYDEYTYYHSANVSILSVALGHKLGLNRAMLIELGMVAIFHDIGKIEVPHEILNKPGSLNDNEWGVMKKHPQWGVRSLLKMRNLDDLTVKASIVAFEHHVNFNLSGYPKLKNPSATDLFSRIVTVADKYDAMTSARVYSKVPISQDKALSIMMETTGKEIDPLIFKFFVNMIGVYPIGTLVMLDTNEIGIVYENNHLFLSRPRVMIISDNRGDLTKGRVTDLMEKDGNDAYVRTIIKAMNLKQFNINLADYFL